MCSQLKQSRCVNDNVISALPCYCWDCSLAFNFIWGLLRFLGDEFCCVPSELKVMWLAAEGKCVCCLRCFGCEINSLLIDARRRHLAFPSYRHHLDCVSWLSSHRVCWWGVHICILPSYLPYLLLDICIVCMPSDHVFNVVW